jgi:hypothetical protein
MRRRQAEYIAVDGRCVIGVIEHQKIGKFLFAQFARHLIEREQPVRHGGEGEKSLAFVPHHHVEPEMIARQRQNAAARIPDRDRERPTQHRPQRVAKLLPAGEQHARIRPRPRLPRHDTDPLQHVVAIVEPHVSGDQRAARALPRLAIELVLRRHAHQHVDETDSVGDRHVGSIGTVLTQRIRRAFEAMPGHGFAVEAQQSGDCAHGRAPPNVASGAKPSASAPPTILSSPISTQAWALSAPRSRATPRQRRLAMPRRRNMACAASARGRQSAFIQGLAPRFSTAHETQPISSAEKRRMRRGGRSAQAKMRAAGANRTASRARTSMTAASRK